MTSVRLQIVEWVNDDQPGFVRCELRDAHGRMWSFLGKQPYFTDTWLDANSAYPQPGSLACEVLRQWRDETGRELARIDTERPWDIEAEDGSMQFDVLQEDLTDDD
jgi:hypothetical protein